MTHFLHAWTKKKLYGRSSKTEKRQSSFKAPSKCKARNFLSLHKSDDFASKFTVVTSLGKTSPLSECKIPFCLLSNRKAFSLLAITTSPENLSCLRSLLGMHLSTRTERVTLSCSVYSFFVFSRKIVFVGRSTWLEQTRIHTIPSLYLLRSPSLCT